MITYNINGVPLLTIAETELHRIFVISVSKAGPFFKYLVGSFAFVKMYSKKSFISSRTELKSY